MGYQQQGITILTMKKVRSLLLVAHCFYGKYCLNLQTFDETSLEFYIYNIPQNGTTGK